MHYITVCTV